MILLQSVAICGSTHIYFVLSASMEKECFSGHKIELHIPCSKQFAMMIATGVSQDWVDLALARYIHM